MPQPSVSPEAPTSMLAGYEVRPGAPDELLDPSGDVRPVWRPLLDHIAALGESALAGRFARGDQYLHDAGVFFRQYGAAGSSERAWPLSHVPVLIHASDWRTLEEGLAQRAELLEAVLADLYGENHLVAEGLLPAEVVARSPEWLRPLVGVPPRSGRRLHLVAFDVGRGPDGGWRVLSDRCQAPSGAGFALENRAACSRGFAEVFAGARVRPLDRFFAAFRRAVLELRAQPDSHAALLTPGPLNDAYYEHAYLARHLGFDLLEGEDLTVRRGRFFIRTIEGLAPVSALWRRVDSTFCDPLELDESSRLGVPGLVDAIRSGAVELVNALGSGVLEARALFTRLPRLAEALRSEPLLLPQAYGEAVRLSTTPAYVGGRLQPRPMALRVFLARTSEGWTVMPGGYARIGRAEDAEALAMQRGGSVADVWIIDEQAAPAGSPGTPAAAVAAAVARPSALADALPSRSADNLYWLGRYVARAEGMIRLLRAHRRRSAETPQGDAPLPAFLSRYLRHVGLEGDGAASTGLASALAAARACGARVRDRISADGWTALSALAERGEEPGEDAAGALLQQIAVFAGLVHESMHRSTDWRFLALGGRLERAMTMATALAWLADPAAPEGALEVALELGDSVEAHRRSFASAPTRASVVEILAFDALSPRSIRSQLDEICEHVAALPGAEERGVMSATLRAAHVVRAKLVASTPETLDARALGGLWDDLAALSERLSDAYLR